MNCLMTRVAAPGLLLLATMQAAQSQVMPAMDESRPYRLVVAPDATFEPDAEMLAQFDEILEYVGERMDIPVAVLKRTGPVSSLSLADLPEEIRARFAPPERDIIVSIQEPGPGECPFRGRAMAGAIDLFVSQQTSRIQVLAVFAHELGHLFHWSGVGRGGPGDFWAQGFASWAAGSYWTDWMGASSFDEIMRRLMEEGRFIPLGETGQLAETIFPNADGTAAPGCLERRDIIFTEWAAFIDFLDKRYGRAKLYELASAPNGAGDRLYEDVYARTLAELAAEWLQSL